MANLIKIPVRFDRLDSLQVERILIQLNAFGETFGPFNTENYTNFFVYLDSENLAAIDNIKDSIRVICILARSKVYI